MRKIKTKVGKKIKILILSAILLFTFSSPAMHAWLTEKAYAADGDTATTITCPEGWTPNQANKTCTTTTVKDAEGKDVSCPEGFTKLTKTDQELVCKQTTKTTENVAANEAVTNFISIMLTVQGFLNRLIWPILAMIGGLLNNDLLFGNGMAERIRSIWIPIRDLVNILFIIALVGVAFYNILGLGDEGGNYGLKSMLPKLVVGLIAVNFSFVGMKVFLDGVNVLTSAIFALPGQVSEGLDKIIDPESSEYDQELLKRFCAQSSGFKMSEFGEGQQGYFSWSANNELNAIRTIASQHEVEFDPTDSYDDIYQKIYAKYENDPATLNAMGGSFVDEINEAKERSICSTVKDDQGNTKFQLTKQGREYLTKYHSGNAALALALNMSQMVFFPDIDNDSKTVSSLSINILTSAVLYIVYLVSFLALFIVLLARLVVLWLAVALSPLLLLALTVPVVKDKIPGMNDFVDQFMKNAIAPVGIAAAMSIGWIMLRALQSIKSMDSTNTVLNTTVGIPVVGLNTLQEVVVAAATIGVVWIAVFAAADSTIAKGVTESIKGFVQGTGAFIAKAPLRYLRVIPVKTADGDTVNASLGDVGQVMRDAKGLTTSKGYDELKNAMGMGKTPSLNNISNAKTPEDAVNALYDYRNNMGDQDVHTRARQLASTPGFMNKLRDYDRPLHDAFKKYIDDEKVDKGNAKALLKEVDRMKRQIDSGKKPSADTSSKSTSPKFAGKEATSAQQTQFNTFNSTINDNIKNETATSTALQQLHKDGMTFEELKENVEKSGSDGKKKWEQLVKAYGNQGKLKTEFEKEPPAASTPPAGTTPPPAPPTTTPPTDEASGEEEPPPSTD